MDILFASKNWERLCHEPGLAARTLGDDGARKLQSRLDDLYAAVNLGYAPNLPGRFRPLDGNFEGCFSIQLIDGHHMVIRPTAGPSAKRAHGDLDLSSITSVCIVFIGENHD